MSDELKVDPKVESQPILDWHLNEFIKVNEHRLSPKTAKNYKYFLTKLKRFVGVKYLVALNEQEIRSYIDQLAKDDVSPTSINTIISAMRAFYTWLEKYDYITKSPMRRIEDVKAEKKLPISCTDDEIERLRKEAFLRKEESNDDFTYLAFETLLQTGIRVSELIQIKKYDFDFKLHTLKVHGKGAKERVVYFDPALSRELQHYCEGFLDDALVFPYSTATVERRFRIIRKRLGIGKQITPHKMRNTYSANFIRTDGNVVSLQKLLGHESLNTTQGYFNREQNLVREDYYKTRAVKNEEEKTSDKEVED